MKLAGCLWGVMVGAAAPIRCRHAILGALLAITVNQVCADDPPFTAVWTAVPDCAVTLADDFEAHGVLADGRAVFVAMKPGETTYRILLFDPQTNAWAWKSEIPVKGIVGWNWAALRNHLHVSPLADGRCLVLGTATADGSGPILTYLYDPATDVYSRKTDLALGWDAGLFQAVHSVPLPNTEVYVFGTQTRSSGDTRPNQGFIYNFTDDTWRVGPAAPLNTTMGNDRIVWPDGNVSFRWFLPNSGQYEHLATLDPEGLTWTVVARESPGAILGQNSTPLCNVGSRAYIAGAGDSSYPSSIVAIYAVDNVTKELGEIDRRTGVAALKCPVSLLSAAGRDWLTFSYTTNNSASAAYGLYDSQVYDDRGSRWLNLPTCPKDLLVGSGYQREHVERIPLADGFLLLSHNGGYSGVNDGVVRAARLVVSSAPVPPQVAADLPAGLTLDEGTSQTFTYRLTGDIPPGGVDVVVERLSGDGNVLVGDGARQRVLTRGTDMTVRIFAQTDADAADDAAVIRLRVVQADGGADENARTMTVAVRDLYHDGNQPPAIVSPAWADPNPAPLPAGTTVHVVASDPDGDPLTYAWSKVSGGGTASFAAPAAADSGVTFSAAGTYALRVTVNDGRGGNATSEVTVAVTDGSGADPRADCNGDKVVNALDLQIVIANFGQTVP